MKKELEKNEDDLIKEHWTYSYTEGSKNNRPIYKHHIKYKGKIITTTKGAHETEGMRCKKIVQKCNASNAIPNTSVCSADLSGSPESRAAKMTKLTEKRNLALANWESKHTVQGGYSKTDDKFTLWAVDREGGKQVAKGRDHEEAATKLAELLKVTDWEGFRNV